MQVSGILAVIGLSAAAVAVAATPSRRAAEPPSTAIKVVNYKSPTCGCCKNWEAHLRQNGFTVESHDMDDVSPMKTELGVPRNLVSCHTAVIGKYVIEGHVPAADIERLLREQPKIVGLSAPGMPPGAPGMDAGKQPYDVIAFDASGKTSVWAKH
jgi:hypothetical protein